MTMTGLSGTDDCHRAENAGFGKSLLVRFFNPKPILYQHDSCVVSDKTFEKGAVVSEIRQSFGRDKQLVPSDSGLLGFLRT